MTALPEAKLAREAEMAYAMLALVTDYDCWHPDHDAVTVETVVATMHANSAMAQSIIRHAIPHIGEGFSSPAHSALASAIMTAAQAIPPERLSQLSLLLDPYFNKKS
jgi:5'-methylthioadenosine phosphorylase